jgi:general stress protein 26
MTGGLAHCVKLSSLLITFKDAEPPVPFQFCKLYLFDVLDLLLSKLGEQLVHRQHFIVCTGRRNPPLTRRYTEIMMEWNMANENARNVDRAWELMKKIGFAMLVTRDGDKLRARPMSAYLEREENAIYMLTDARRHKDNEIASNPPINLSFADASSQKYVSLTGTAVVSDDRAKIKELFSTPAKAWWESADDPNIRVLKITPDDAEFWDSPGSIISYVKMAAAAVTSTRPEIGENRKISM